ncbi:MAG: hypothetical protein WA051_01555 [Minisyncoccia bacterium]
MEKKPYLKIPVSVAIGGLIIAIGIFFSTRNNMEGKTLSAVGGSVVNTKNNTAEDQAVNSIDTSPANAIDTSVTEDIGKTILSKLVATKSYGQPITTEYVNNTVMNVLDSADTKNNAPKVEWTPNISQDNNKTAVKKYASDAATIILGFLTSTPSTEISNSPQKVMAFNAVVYRFLAETMSRQPVPSSYAEFHTSIVNNAYAMSHYYAQLAKVDNDPAAVFIAVPKIKQEDENFSQNILNLANKLKQDGIIFTSDDAGYFWMQ